MDTAKPASNGAFARRPLPKRFCNLDRLAHALEARGLDGIVATTPNNVFYLSGFNGIAHKSDEPRVCAVIISRHVPEHPVLVVADYYLATFLTQESERAAREACRHHPHHGCDFPSGSGRI